MSETNSRPSEPEPTEPEPTGNAPRRPPALPFLAAATAVVIAVAALLWWLLGREPEPEPAASGERVQQPGIDGIVLRDAAPDRWLAGDCLTDFDPSDEHGPATVITCDHEHDVQVVHWEEMDDSAWPGDETVASRAREICGREGLLDQTAVDQSEAELQLRVSHPTDTTWRREQDRRVNCLLQRADGGPLIGGYVADPEESSSAALTDGQDARDA
ncbi:hypothetical protein [Nesterenkonia sp. F]|uniref:hypothetical protein n=1 Tax=Nesterenkonia sp. F TaxID=795955 RepID=UPI000255C81A|nr:hypothetical protein [Nesterenkonia sp. F]